MRVATLMLAAVALCATAKDKVPLVVPDRAEQIEATRQVKILGIPILSIKVTRRGEAGGDPKRGPVQIQKFAPPRDPLAEEIEAARPNKPIRYSDTMPVIPDPGCLSVAVSPAKPLCMNDGPRTQPPTEVKK